MKNKIIYAIGWVLLLIVSGCSDWLSVSPRTEKPTEQLFETQNGFRDALTGAYIEMMSDKSYGEYLTMSKIEYLVDFWDPEKGSGEEALTLHRYSDAQAVTMIDALYEQQYKVILAVNAILEYVDLRQAIFDPGAYEAVKGECLALRAMCHLDILRLFGPVPAEATSVPILPYVETVTKELHRHVNFDGYKARLIADLENAEGLLKQHLEKQSEIEEDYFKYRTIRMNYYAVKALVARVYLWAGQTPKAGNIANELIAHPLLGTNRILFRLYSDKITTMSDDYFTANSENNSQLSLSQNQRKEFYETEKYESSDKRIPSWLILNPNTIESDANTGRYFVSKYNQNGPMNQGIPLLRMTEIQYICAECQSEPAKGLDYLNTVRHEYGIPAAFDLTKENCVFEEELFKEYRKSFLAEGQLFFFLKRKDYTDIPGALNIENPRKIFCFPLPDDEKEFGNLITK